MWRGVTAKKITQQGSGGGGGREREIEREREYIKGKERKEGGEMGDDNEEVWQAQR